MITTEEPTMERCLRTLAVVVAVLGAAAAGIGFDARAGDEPGGGDPAPYRLVAGDRVRVEIAGGILDPIELPIPSDGRIAVPKVGSLLAAGRTPEELVAEIRTVLEETGYAGRLDAWVTIVALAPRTVYLLEGVRNPGAYELPVGGSLRLTQVLALAGGISEEANRRDVRILRPRTGGGLPAVIRFDLSDITSGDRIENDIRILPGDTVFLPDRRRPDGWVYVGGAVREPGRRPLLASDGWTVWRAVVTAGGLAPGADPTSVRLLRLGGAVPEIVRLDLTRALEGDGEAAGDPPIGPGDLILVPGGKF
jgi:polysaccharide export outer membrane protein